MRLDEVILTLPIIDSKADEDYALILTDSLGYIHFFNFDGTYEGYLVGDSYPIDFNARMLNTNTEEL